MTRSARVIEGPGQDKKSQLGGLVKRLRPRWFVVKGAKSSALSLRTPRHTMSHLRGPMTPHEVKRACELEQRRAPRASGLPAVAGRDGAPR